MTYADLRVTLAGPVGEIVLARPETRNALTAAMGDELERAVREANAESSLRVVLVRGEGACFSSGGDFAMLSERARASETENRTVMRRFYASFLAIRGLAVPSIAVLEGPVVGAGLCLAMACDIRVASKTAKLSANFVRVGLHPGMGATWLLPRLVGVSKATELLFTGESLSAEQAQQIGLVNRVADPEALMHEAQTLAQAVARGAPHAVALTKATLRSNDDAGLSAALDGEAEAQAQSFASRDLHEALQAFREKRAPRFTGE